MTGFERNEIAQRNWIGKVAVSFVAFNSIEKYSLWCIYGGIIENFQINWQQFYANGTSVWGTWTATKTLCHRPSKNSLKLRKKSAEDPSIEEMTRTKKEEKCLRNHFIDAVFAKLINCCDYSAIACYSPIDVIIIQEWISEWRVQQFEIGVKLFLSFSITLIINWCQNKRAEGGKANEIREIA